MDWLIIIIIIFKYSFGLTWTVYLSIEFLFPFFVLLIKWAYLFRYACGFYHINALHYIYYGLWSTFSIRYFYYKLSLDPTLFYSYSIWPFIGWLWYVSLHLCLHFPIIHSFWCWFCWLYPGGVPKKVYPRKRIGTSLDLPIPSVLVWPVPLKL